MKIAAGLALSVSLFSVSELAIAADGQDLANRFGALEAISQISLSPDGNKIAYVAPDPNYGSKVYVADLTNGAPPVMAIASHGKDEPIYKCSWSTETRLICSIYVIYNDAGQLLGFTRSYALNSDGTNVVSLTASTTKSISIVQHGGSIIDWDVPGKPGSVLMTRQFALEDTRDSNIAKRPAGFGVEEVDSLTTKRKTIERPRTDAADYITDGHGNVRVMGSVGVNADGYMRSRMHYSYRKPGSSEWESLSTIDLNATANGGFNPVAVDAAKNVAYGFDNNEGFSALYSLALDGSQTKALILGRNDVDVDSLVRIGRDDRVVGVSYATERRATEFFDPELKKLGAGLERALPGHPLISFVDASADETKLVLFASSDTDPGRFYLFDKSTRQLGEILPVRPQLDGMKMAEMRAITFPAADGTKIPAYLTLPVGSSGKGLPAIVMPHGGPGARDEWGFDWLVQFYAARGFAVIQPNFRGSAGYGADWYQRNGFQSWRTAIGDVNDAGHWLVSQGIAAPDKLAIVGWSYGGYAALQSSVAEPNLFKAIVAIAPVTDLERLRSNARRYANFELVSNYIGTGPHVREGSPAQNVGKFEAPVLMFHGDKDQNVDIEQSRFMTSELQRVGKKATLVEFPGLSHSLTDSAARSKLLSQSDAFLRKSMGLPAD